MNSGSAILIVAAIAVAHGQQAGQWVPKRNYAAARKYFLTPAQQQALTRTLDSLEATLHAAPVFQPPRGFEAWYTVSVRSDCDACAKKAAMVEAALVFATGNPPEGAAAAVVRINDPEATLQSDRTSNRTYKLGLTDERGHEMAFEPLRTADFHGFAFYDNSRLILSRGARPYWLPVSREQYLNAMIRKVGGYAAQGGGPGEVYRRWVADGAERKRERARLYAEFKKMDPAMAEKFLSESEKQEAALGAQYKAEVDRLGAESPFEKGLRAIRAELAALTPQQRAAQAWVMVGGVSDGLNGSGLVAAGTPGATRLITLNPDFFDLARRGTVQLITVEIGWDPPGTHPSDLAQINEAASLPNARLLEFLRTVDWAKVAALTE